MINMSVIGIFLGLIVIIALSMRGVNIIISAPIAAILILLFDGKNFGEIIEFIIGNNDSFMIALAGFISDFFPLFLLGAILAKLTDKSGAAQSLADMIIRIIGNKNRYSALLSIYLISVIMTLGGISLFVIVFVIVPLARPIFQKMKISWNLVSTPIILGSATFTMTMLPGSPSIQNAIPTAYLNTTLTAAPLIGVSATVVTIIATLIFMKFSVDRDEIGDSSFIDIDHNHSLSSNRSMDSRPGFFAAITPLIILFIIIVIGSFCKIDDILIIGLCLSIVLSVLLFWKYFDDIVSVMNEGALDSIKPILFTASTIAFGILITKTRGFDELSRILFTSNLPAIFKLSIITSFFGGVTGSASGAEGIVLQSFSKQFLDDGLNAEVIHRITAISSSIFVNMPHSGVVLTMLSLTNLTHKRAYKNIFIGFTLVNLLGLFTALFVYYLT